MKEIGGVIQSGSLMPMMGVIYFIVTVWRATELKLKLNTPFFHGREYFFDTRVGDGFYQGSGKAILAEFRRRVFLPYIVEIVVTAVIAVVFPGNFLYLILWMLVAAIAGAWLYQRLVWDMAKRGRAMETQIPAPAILAVPFQARTTEQYRSVSYERAIVTLTLAGFALLAGVVAWRHRIYMRGFLLGPLLCLYAQFGAILAQRRVIGSLLLRLPPGIPEKFLEWRESYRLYWVRLLDIFRMIFAGMIFQFGLLEATGLGRERGLPWMTTGIAILTVIAMLLTRQEIAKFVNASRNVGPMPYVAPIPPPSLRVFARWFCWDADWPAVIVKTAGRYTLNLGNRAVYFFGAYLLGFAAIVAFVRIGGR